VIAAALLAAAIAGVVPEALGPPSRVVWIDAGSSGQTAQIECAVVASDRWRCDGVPDAAPGIVVLVGAEAVAHQCFVVCDGTSRAVVHRWGGLVVLDSGGITPDDLRHIRLSAWKPGRSAVRPAVRRFRPVDDADVEVVRVSDVMFWIAGDSADPDRYLSVDGPSIGSIRLATAALTEAQPEAPLFVSLGTPFSLTGRVLDPRGEDVDHGEVELFELLHPSASNTRASLGTEPVILRATAFSDSAGAFTFDHLVPGTYFISVVDDNIGRGSLWIRSFGDPAVVRLVAPTRATGRVVKHQSPVASARVRFVPNVETFTAGVDPRLSIVEETTTAQDGSFSLALPPQSVGAIQVLAPDGVSARVPILGTTRTKEIALGTISLPDRRVLALRLLDPAPCALTAVGPLQYLGLTAVQASEMGGLHWFDIPEAGEWALTALCSDVSYPLLPGVVAVPASGPDTYLDVRLVR
jgi:hypothetical protein